MDVMCNAADYSHLPGDLATGRLLRVMPSLENKPEAAYKLQRQYLADMIVGIFNEPNTASAMVSKKFRHNAEPFFLEQNKDMICPAVLAELRAVYFIVVPPCLTLTPDERVVVDLALEALAAEDRRP